MAFASSLLYKQALWVVLFCFVCSFVVAVGLFYLFRSGFVFFLFVFKIAMPLSVILLQRDSPFKL